MLKNPIARAAVLVAALPLSFAGASLAFAQTAASSTPNTGAGAEAGLNAVLLGVSALVVVGAARYLVRTAPQAGRN